jgi:hypothetical protein
MPTGQERLVLMTCDKLAGHGHGFVLASDVALKTGMGPQTIRDCLRGLDRDGLVDLAPLENGDLSATVTPRGRQELAKVEAGGGMDSPETRTPTHIKVVPKGLRSFDEHEADFFLDLLPGRSGNDRLPESVRYWTQLILSNDIGRRLRVGVISGPPGCGKTSFTRAGLIPILRENRTILYINCFLDKLESRLLKSFQNAWVDLPDKDSTFTSILAMVKEFDTTGNPFFLIFIDQFEQLFLSKNNERFEKQLEEILVLANQSYLQCIIIVSDEFASMVFLLIENLGIDFKVSQHSRRIDPLTMPYAKKILMAYGQSMGFIDDYIRPNQLSFLNKAVEGSTQDGMVIPIRLALLTETLKGMEEWTEKTLEDVGGTQGAVKSFLHYTFYSEYSDPRYKRYCPFARSLLKELIPREPVEIESNKCRLATLYTASKCKSEEEFFKLVRILDEELRLITPTVLHEDSRSGLPWEGNVLYKISHRFLVQVIREWLREE